MTDANAATVNLTGAGPLPAKQVVVMHSLQRLGQIVPTSQWCLIGGFMVEILLISRGGMMLRPTDDADIIGDVVADRAVLRKLAHGILDMKFEESPNGNRTLCRLRSGRSAAHHPYPVRARRSLRESIRLAHDQERTRPEQASARTPLHS